MRRILIFVFISTLILLSFFSLPSITSKTNDENSDNTSQIDLMIIFPIKFQNEIQPLIEHKQKMNIITTSLTTEFIFEEYNGLDKQEKIKNCIKQAYDELNISFVLLIGDFKDIPVRYVHNNDEFEFFGNEYDYYFISDLYYADLYDENGVFQSWNTDGNDIYGEWNGEFAKDYDISLTPEVALGRLPCSIRFQLKIMIDKIIEYETSPKDDSWFNRFVVAGGDTYPEFPGNEGEQLTAKAAEIMSDFEAVKLWASTETLSTGSILREFSAGCGFIYLSGHGNAGTWVTHPPNSDVKIGKLTNLLIPLIRNKHKLPVCITGGCLNSQFDVYPLRIFYDSYKYFTWCYSSLSWKLTSSPYGGAIATIGNTHLSWMNIEYGGGGSNWLEIQFFREYVNGTMILGDIWKNAITSYVETFPIDWGTPSGKISSIDAKTVQQWVLFGDPTLRIGGEKL